MEIKARSAIHYCMMKWHNHIIEKTISVLVNFWVAVAHSFTFLNVNFIIYIQSEQINLQKQQFLKKYSQKIFYVILEKYFFE